MRTARAEWDAAHTAEDVDKARTLSAQKLKLARDSKGAGRGRGNRGGEIESPWRAKSAADRKAEERAKRAREEAESRVRAAFEAAGMAVTEEQLATAVAHILAQQTAK